MRVSVRVVKGPGRGGGWSFDKPGAFLIGRGEGVDLQLSADDPYVSRRHAYLEISPPVCKLQNLSLKNPSLLNGRPVRDVSDVRDGDVIELGFTQIQISLSLSGPPVVSGGENPVEETPARQPGSPQPAIVRVRCHYCGTDLSSQANADGRASELSDVALYSCPRCLPAGDEHDGHMVAHYRVRRCLGVGGMGAVYLAQDSRTRRVVALKVIVDIPARELVDRFARETAVLRDIRLPHVLRYIDSGKVNGSPFLVTEYLPDGNLDELIATGPVSVETAVRLTIGVLSGLAALHEKGIIHRDIKPANLLLRANHQSPECPWWPIIADFGLALTYARAGGARLTKPGTPLGTVMFMPPEQIRDPHNVGPTADVYAVGVTLYYLLSLRYPFDFPTPADIARFQYEMGNARDPREALQALIRLQRLRHPYVIVLEDAPLSLRDHCSGLPEELIAIVDSAIEKDSRQRIKSARDFSARLEGVLPKCVGVRHAPGRVRHYAG